MYIQTALKQRRFNEKSPGVPGLHHRMEKGSTASVEEPIYPMISITYNFHRLDKLYFLV